LAHAAGEIAGGNLHARTTVEGDDELAMLSRAFNEMADKLEVSMEQEAALRARAETLLKSNRDLIANVSHELRTPVALVRGHLEALGSEPEHVDEYARIALRETDRLERLVDDLFQLTRVESEGVKLERVPFDAGSAAREAVESLAEPARRDAGIVMQAHVEEGDLRCVGDRARLVQVLQNLIRNAIRFTPEGGIILASVCNDGDDVEIVVRDTGIGIPPADVPHVFERFYRSEQSRNRSGGGAGLGLAIAKGLIEAMGGTIEVESVVDEGSAFTIRLPLAAKIAANGTNGTNGAKLNGTPLPSDERAVVSAGR
jgi:signal transduction histidine kinase